MRKLSHAKSSRAIWYGFGSGILFMLAVAAYLVDYIFGTIVSLVFMFLLLDVGARR